MPIAPCLAPGYSASRRVHWVKRQGEMAFNSWLDQF